jgi:hypothetical protein
MTNIKGVFLLAVIKNLNEKSPPLEKGVRGLFIYNSNHRIMIKRYPLR